MKYALFQVNSSLTGKSEKERTERDCSVGLIRPILLFAGYSMNWRNDPADRGSCQPCYSYRSATIGSTRVAFRAGR